MRLFYINTIIILCKIIKNGEWIDIDQNSIVKNVVNETSRIEKNYLSIIEEYIINTIKS